MDTIIEKRQSVYISFVPLVFTRTMYHAHIEQQSTISTTEPTVMKSEFPKQSQKCVILRPFL